MLVVFGECVLWVLAADEFKAALMGSTVVDLAAEDSLADFDVSSLVVGSLAKRASEGEAIAALVVNVASLLRFFSPLKFSRHSFTIFSNSSRGLCLEFK